MSHWGYSNLLATSSTTHHAILKSLGAKQVFDYRSPDCIPSILESVSSSGGIKFVLDCIGSQDGSLRPISKLVGKGAKVAAMLPVIVRDASETAEPIYSFDVSEAAQWADGVSVSGVRTHFYLEVSLPPSEPLLNPSGFEECCPDRCPYEVKNEKANLNIGNLHRMKHTKNSSNQRLCQLC